MSNNILNGKSQLIENVLFRLSLNAAFQRNKIYKKKVSQTEEKMFKEYLRHFVENWLSNALSKNSYTDAHHYRAIKGLSEKVTRKFSHILDRNNFSIGTSQKLLNVYWKTNWVFKKGVKEPIHCPFDGIIIKSLPGAIKKTKWTNMKRIEEYKSLVKAARAISGGVSLAEWELTLYNKNGLRV